jgi:hypothetical protein
VRPCAAPVAGERPSAQLHELRESEVPSPARLITVGRKPLYFRSTAPRCCGGAHEPPRQSKLVSVLPPNALRRSSAAGRATLRACVNGANGEGRNLLRYLPDHTGNDSPRQAQTFRCVGGTTSMPPSSPPPGRQPTGHPNARPPRRQRFHYVQARRTAYLTLQHLVQAYGDYDKITAWAEYDTAIRQWHADRIAS